MEHKNQLNICKDHREEIYMPVYEKNCEGKNAVLVVDKELNLFHALSMQSVYSKGPKLTLNRLIFLSIKVQSQQA